MCTGPHDLHALSRQRLELLDLERRHHRALGLMPRSARGPLSDVDAVGARRSGQDGRDVLEKLDTTVEGAAADHVKTNIGITVVDPLATAAPRDDGKDNHAEAVDETRFEKGSAQGEAPNGAH